MKFTFWIKSSINQLDYLLRNFIKWRRKGYSLKHTLTASHISILNRHNPIAAERLIHTYHLLNWLQFSDLNNLLENFYYLEMLESALLRSNIELHDNIHVADIGVSYWFYVRSFYALLTWYKSSTPRSFWLSGYEIDPFRVYLNFHSRYDLAQAYIKGLQNVSYHPKEFSYESEKFDMITLLFPFIFLSDHLQWGLPFNQFKPKILLQNAYLSLKVNGLMIIVNQGEEEYNELAIILPSPLTILDRYQFSSDFFYYEIPRYLTIAQKIK